MARRPNIIHIFTDDQGFGDAGCHGNPWLRTPHIDRLHSRSVRLTDFHVDPMCAPSRAALTTGRYSARTGVWSTLTGRYIMNREETTIAELLRDAGYRTGMFGKWHLGDSYPYRPMDRGFDESVVFGGGVVGEIPDWWNNDYFSATYLRNGEPERFEGFCTDIWFTQGTAFIESCGGDPFYCYIPTNAPHGPMDVHDRYREPYLASGVPHERAGFFGMIENIDENLGRLVATLVRLGIAEDTILIFGGDNGTAAGVSLDRAGFTSDGYNAGMRGKKCWALDGGHRNMCLVSWPAGRVGTKGTGSSGGPGVRDRAGRDLRGVSAQIDLLPTLLELCGLSIPDDLDLDGMSLAPFLRDDGADEIPPRTICVHNQQLDTPRKGKDLEVVAPEWRLTVIEQWGEPGTYLFHASSDPGQTTNLSTERRDVVSELLREYDRWWKRVSVRFQEYSNIVVGAAQTPESKLTSHAWHDSSGMFNQWHVRPGPVDNGFWAIDVERAGSFEVELRRWPREAGTPIRAGLPARTGVPFVHDLPAGAALPIARARIRIGEHEQMREVADGDLAAVFRARLDRGPTRLQSWFVDQDGVERGAYYAYVRRLGS